MLYNAVANCNKLKFVACHHLSIRKFISALQRELGLVEVKQAKCNAGDKPTKRRKDQANAEALKDMVELLLSS